MKRRKFTKPPIPRDRAERRANDDRVKAKFYAKQKEHELWATDEKTAGKYCNHGKTCSCWMCRNPRRNGELTIQELKANDKLADREIHTAQMEPEG